MRKAENLDGPHTAGKAKTATRMNKTGIVMIIGISNGKPDAVASSRDVYSCMQSLVWMVGR